MPDYGFPVDDVVSAAKDAIRRANASPLDAAADIHVTAMSLTLKVVATEKGGGRLEFTVPVIGMKLKFGASITNQDTHTLVVNLIPPVDAGGEAVRGGWSMADDLVGAITVVRATVEAAGSGEPPFVLKDASIDLNFAVTNEGSIVLGVEGELKDEVTHALKLTLGPPPRPPATVP